MNARRKKRRKKTNENKRKKQFCVCCVFVALQRQNTVLKKKCLFCSRISYGYLRFKLLSRCTCFGYTKKPQVLRRLHAPIALLLVAVCFCCCCYFSVHLFLSFFPTFLSFASFRSSFFLFWLFICFILVFFRCRWDDTKWLKKNEYNLKDGGRKVKTILDRRCCSFEGSSRMKREKKITWNLVCWVLLFAGSKCRQKN